ncbi:HEAT repeat domain-containing protein [Sorangium sp. So ce1000]|uniref:HEAT repeat domain-containing protein n=1 Tax=Sorangium sp. So ce1000 TaxID=3133325 RepID=UPI003F5D9D42
MPTLSSLLVQHGVTSMRVVEEAIARQVLHGGDLATNVLELGAVRERELTALLAESLGLPPAVGRLRPASPEVLRTIPVDLAVQHRVFPLDVRTGLDAAATGAMQREAMLVIATAEPLAVAVAEELSFALGVNLRQLAAPLVRIRQALAEHYGVALERRLSRLVKQLDARAEPSPDGLNEPGLAVAAAVAPEASPPTGSPAGADAAPRAAVDATSSAQVGAPSPAEVVADPSAEIAAASPPGADAVPPAGVDATSLSGVGAASPASVDDNEDAVETQQRRPSIEDAPTVESLTSIYDEDTVIAEVALNEAVPTPRKPPLHELDDEPTVVAAYPLDLSSLRYPEARAPRIEAVASHLAARDPGEEAAHAGQAPASQGEPAIEPAVPTPRSEQLAPRLSPFAPSEAVHTSTPAEAAAPPVETPDPASTAAASPGPAPSGARSPAPGTQLLTGWLKRASAVHRPQQEALPRAAVAPQRQPDGAVPAPTAPAASAPAAPVPAVSAPAAAPATSAPAASVPAVAAPSAQRREVLSSAPAAKVSMREAGRSAPAAQRRKGPFTLAMAEHALTAVGSSEEVLAVLFDFAQQYFEYTVLFTVHGERAEGRNAAGPGADRERVTKIAVPFERPSALAKARALRAPLVTALAGSAPDAELQRELGRKVHAAAVAVVPIVVRGRVVALVYGDDGVASVELSNIGDLIALAGIAATVLERLILRKKQNRSGGAQQSDGPAPPDAAAPPLKASAPLRPTAAPSQDAAAQPEGAAARSEGAAAPSEGAAARSEGAAAPSEGAAASLQDAASRTDEHVTDGPLSLRTRAALLELSSMVRAEAHGSPTADAGARLPPADEDLDAGEPPRTDGPDVAPQATRLQGGWSTEDGGSGIDAVARAFGLRGTGVEAEPVQSGEGVAHAMAFSSTIPPAPTQHAQGLGAESKFRLGLEADADVVSGTAVTAPMMPAITPPTMPAVTAPMMPAITPPMMPAITAPQASIAAGSSAPAIIDEIPDLEIPAAPVLAPSEDLDLGEPEEARTKRYSRPPWMLDSSIMPGAEEPRELAPAPAAGRPSWRRRTPVAVETAAPYARPPSERRAAVSSSPAGDLRAEYTSLLQHVLAGGEAGARAFAELVRNGETAISIVAARFPGPLRVDRQRFREQLAGPEGATIVAAAPPASQCGPLLELIVAIRRPALPFITVRSASPDPEVRLWATHVLGELPYPEAANALLPRLFDDSIAVRRIAIRSAASLIAAPPAGGPILQGLDHIARDREESPARRLSAIETMTEIRSGASVPALVSALADPHEAIVEAAARALVVITRDDLGRDARRWLSWWSMNGERHRIEWIIDALTHEKPAIRRAAIDELKGITKEYFGYYEDLPRQEREAAQERYRAWWISEGRSRFRTTG